MSTYMIAFAVTDFEYRKDSKSPMPAIATSNNCDKISSLLVESEKMIKALENYLQVPYMLPKMDQICIPSNNLTKGGKAYQIKVEK